MKQNIMYLGSAPAKNTCIRVNQQVYAETGEEKARSHSSYLMDELGLGSGAGAGSAGASAFVEWCGTPGGPEDGNRFLQVITGIGETATSIWFLLPGNTPTVAPSPADIEKCCCNELNGNLYVVHALTQDETLDITMNYMDYNNASVLLYASTGFTPMLKMPNPASIPDDWKINVYIHKSSGANRPAIDLGGGFLWHVASHYRHSETGSSVLFLGDNTDNALIESFTLRKLTLYGGDGYDFFNHVDHLKSNLFFKNLSNDLSGTVTWDRLYGNKVYWNIDSNQTLALTGFKDCEEGAIYLTQPATGGPYEVTLPGDSRIQANNPYLSESLGVRKVTGMANSETYMICFIKKGTTYIWNVQKYI